MLRGTSTCVIPNNSLQQFGSIVGGNFMPHGGNLSNGSFGITNYNTNSYNLTSALGMQ